MNYRFGLIFCVVLSVPAWADTGTISHSVRLSQWLSEHPIKENQYALGLSWNTPLEKPQQLKIKLYLIDILEHANPQQTNGRGLAQFIDSLPVTGRVPVVSHNVPWLAANPQYDPVILPGDQIVIPKQVHQVTIIGETGELCQSEFHSDYLIQDYLRACSQNKPIQSDQAWLIQPDGTVSSGSIAYWQPTTLDHPAPGAWIWAPKRSSSWDTRFSNSLAAFLATQGPARDRGPIQTSTSPAMAQPKAWRYTSNDWGEVGLLQTPTARMRPTGDFSFTYSDSLPYIRGNLFLQPLDWLEFGFRYSDVTNRPYGSQSLSGSQNYIDKSIDAKVSVHKESAWTPQVSFGLRDLAGTGLFSGEYVVTSKHTPNMDWSLGMGWGYLGASGNIQNPLGILDSNLKQRPSSASTTGNGGVPTLGSYFRGPAALFGGVEYQTPWDHLHIKLEYEGNNYSQEPLGEVLPQNTHWNMGLVYAAAPSVDLTAGYERGNQFIFAINLHDNLKDLQTPKLSDPPVVPVSSTYPKAASNWTLTTRDLETQTKWKIVQISQNKNILLIDVVNPRSTYWQSYLDRAIRVLHRDTPFSVDYFVFRIHEEGTVVAEEHVDRLQWMTSHTQYQPPSLQELSVIPVAPLSPMSQMANSGKPVPLSIHSASDFDFNSGVNFDYFLGGPNSFILYSIAPYEEIKYHFNDSTWVQGSIQYDILNNYNNFTYDAPSNLPRVRTYIREYVTTSRLTMPNLQLTTVKNLTPDQYLSFYAGYLEVMFGGVGSEWLYRPFESHFALGVDINEVQQRNFNDGLGFMNYRVLTGLGTLYWDTGWQGVHTNLSLGRYLAGDVGGTVDVYRQFKNGIQIGAYATKTNVSSAQFGEGSFDKGIYVNIPFDALLTRSTSSVAHFLWEPLLRDGGARLNRAVKLYDITAVRSHDALELSPSPTPQNQSPPELQAKNTPAKLVPVDVSLKPTVKPSSNQWEDYTYHYSYDLESDLYKQGYSQVSVLYDDSYRLHVSLTQPHYPEIASGAGEALRIILNRMPLETREIILNVNGDIVYSFHDVKKLQSFLNGFINEEELLPTLGVQFLKSNTSHASALQGLRELQIQPTPLSASDVLTPSGNWFKRGITDIKETASESRSVNWQNTLLIGTGAILASSLLDNPLNRLALRMGQKSWAKNAETIGNDLPFLASGVAGLIGVSSMDPIASDTGYSATEAAVTSFVLAEGVKQVVGRARPTTNAGNASFHILNGSASQGNDGFPSVHTVVTWAAVTPFATEYDAPWLYGLAAITNAARVGGRNHWFSDTVAGSLMGYGIGQLFWQTQQHRERSSEIYLTPNGVNLSVKF